MTPLGRLLEPEEVAAAVVVPRLARGGGDQRADARPRRRRHAGVSPFRGSAAFTERLAELRLRARRRRRDGHVLAAGQAERAHVRRLRRPPRPARRAASPRRRARPRPHGRGPRLLLRRRRRGDHRRAAEMRAGELLDFTRMSGAVVKAMRDSPLPIVAAVNGVAAGAGSVLALASDFRLLARSAKFSFLFTRVGLAGADMGAAYLLPRLVGLGRATELLVLGRRGRRRARSRARPRDAGRRRRVAGGGERARPPPRRRSRARVLDDQGAPDSRELDMALGGAIEMEALAQALLMKSDDFGEFYAAWIGGPEPGVERPLIVNPPELPEPVGFSHAVVARGAVYLGGQIGEGASLVEQFDSAAGSSSPRCVPPAASRTSSRRWSSTRRTSTSTARRPASSARSGAGTSGGATPAMALIGVSALFEPDARVELMGVAVLSMSDVLERARAASGTRCSRPDRRSGQARAPEPARSCGRSASTGCSSLSSPARQSSSASCARASPTAAPRPETALRAPGPGRVPDPQPRRARAARRVDAAALARARPWPPSRSASRRRLGRGEPGPASGSATATASA